MAGRNGRRPGPIEVVDVPGIRPYNRATAAYEVTAQADTAEVYIHGDIGGWGIDVDALIAEVAAIDSDRMTVHLNSPGGAVFQGVALFNTLVEHPAHITVKIKGLAASIASVIAQAGDRIEIARTATFMIHDAWGYAEGNEAEMVAMAAILGQLSDQIADVYTARTGRGSVKSWRDLMRAESWFTAAEALEAGLVDEVTKLARREGAATADVAHRSPVVGRYRYPDRDHAPAPIIPGPRGADPDGQGRADEPQASDAPPPEPTPDPEPVSAIEVDWNDLFTTPQEEKTP